MNKEKIMQIKRLTQIAVAALSIAATTAFADYKLIVPQAAGNGTAVWANIVAKHLEKQLGEKVVIQHIPGAKDIAGFNEYHNKLRFDEKTIMVSHGGNAISYLVDRVDYDYKHYDSIGMQNLNVVLGRKTTMNPSTDRIKLAGGSGLEPDGMATAMLVCGNLPRVADYLNCWSNRVVWINGVGGGERRLGFQRGEFNTTRETTSAWFKFYEDIPDNILWFHHGVRDLKTGQQKDDPNFKPGFQFETVFKRYHGAAPTGEFYDAYRLSREFRDVLQKALWVNKGNPNTEKLRTALKNMLTDPVAAKDLEADTGKYDWIIGAAGNKVVDQLRKDITEKKLQDLVTWHDSAYKFKSVYKPELVIK